MAKKLKLVKVMAKKLWSVKVMMAVKLMAVNVTAVMVMAVSERVLATAANKYVYRSPRKVLRHEHMFLHWSQSR